MMNQNGQVASLTTPHGPGEQECLVAAIRNAGLSPLDVDCAEGHMNGKFLDEAIEMNSLWRAHRSDIHKDPLCYTAAKPSAGHQIEGSGITALLRCVYAAQYGHMTPTIHLRQNNPHVDPVEQPIMIVNENLELPFRSAYSTCLAKGFGGTNVSLLGWGTINKEKSPPRASPMQPEVIFWPGGGGQLEGDQLPRKHDGYTIVGSWSKWESAEKMTLDGDGLYGYTMTLGENRTEQFQIWLDGDHNRVLHPGAPRQPQCSSVVGPEVDFVGGTEACRSGEAPCWHVDGREEMVKYNRPVDAVKVLKDASAPEEPEAESLMVGTTELGQPGDTYRITLQVAGSWRLVFWEKLGSKVDSYPTGTYYITASWLDWSLVEMKEDSSTPGIYSIDALLPNGSGSFQIVRDEDWSQILYPHPEPPSVEDAVLGPDDLSGGFSWQISGTPGDKFSIQFQRTWVDGKESRKVSWQQTGHEAQTLAERLALK